MALDRLKRRLDALEGRIIPAGDREEISDFEAARWVAFILNAAADGHRPDWKPRALQIAALLRQGGAA